MIKLLTEASISKIKYCRSNSFTKGIYYYVDFMSETKRCISNKEVYTENNSSYISNPSLKVEREKIWIILNQYCREKEINAASISVTASISDRFPIGVILH